MDRAVQHYATSRSAEAVRVEIQKTRPALIIQNDVSNEHGLTTMVAPITLKVRTPLSPVHVLPAADGTTGLSVPSAALLHMKANNFLVSKRNFLIAYPRAFKSSSAPRICRIRRNDMPASSGRSSISGRMSSMARSSM